MNNARSIHPQVDADRFEACFAEFRGVQSAHNAFNAFTGNGAYLVSEDYRLRLQGQDIRRR